MVQSDVQPQSAVQRTAEPAPRSAFLAVPAWLWLPIGLVPLLVVYVWNPGLRVLSAHGLLHGSVVIEILERGVPPQHPFLAGEPLSYPWLYHWLAAGIVRTTGWAPSIAFAVMNGIAWGVSLFFAYRIGRRLLAEASAPAHAAFVSLCASSFAVPWVWHSFFLEPRGLPWIDPRGVPALDKFTNTSASSLGIATFLAWLLAEVRFHDGGRRWRDLVGIFVATAAVALLYPPNLPGVVVASASIGMALAWARRDWPRSARVLAFASSLLACAAALAAVAPYLRSISGGYFARVQLFVHGTMLRNARNLLVLAGPTVLLLVASRRSWSGRVPRAATILLGTSAVTLFGVYVVLSQPAGNEYKNLVMGMVALGLLAGIALYGLRPKPSTYWPLMAVALFNPTFEVWRKLESFSRRELPVREVEGGYEYVEDPEWIDAYAWLREKTPTDAVVVGDSGLAPLVARRPLFVGDRRPPRLGFNNPLYEFFYVADGELVERRKRGAHWRLRDADLRRMFDLGHPVYAIVDKQRGDPTPLPDEDWELVHTTRRGRISMYRFAPSGG